MVVDINEEVIYGSDARYSSLKVMETGVIGVQVTIQHSGMGWPEGHCRSTEGASTTMYRSFLKPVFFELIQ